MKKLTKPQTRTLLYLFDNGGKDVSTEGTKLMHGRVLGGLSDAGLAERTGSVRDAAGHVVNALWSLTPAGRSRALSEAAGTKTSLDRGREMLNIPMNKLPKPAVAYAKVLAHRFGGCMEIFLTAYCHYAEVVEGCAPCDGYVASSEAHEFFEKESA